MSKTPVPNIRNATRLGKKFSRHEELEKNRACLQEGKKLKLPRPVGNK